MALLNEKQIEEVVHIFLQNRDTNAVVIKTAMENWNEKQQSFIEPNWNCLPSKIKYCHLLHYYFDDKGNEIDFEFISHFERPAPVITPHPHAEMMAKYAEVAARRVDPWV